MLPCAPAKMSMPLHSRCLCHRRHLHSSSTPKQLHFILLSPHAFSCLYFLSLHIKHVERISSIAKRPLICWRVSRLQCLCSQQRRHDFCSSEAKTHDHAGLEEILLRQLYRP
jgi:hypothetical protein